MSYTLIGAGALLDQSGHFGFTALDGDASPSFTVQVADGQSVVERTFTVTVANVAPTLAVAGATHAPDGSLYTIRLSARDPGQDTICLLYT